MVGGVELHRRPDLRAGADVHLDHIENHTVEIEKGAFAQVDVVAVVAVERRPDHRTGTDRGQPLGQQRPALVRRGCQRCVVAHHPGLGRGLVGEDFRVAWVVQLARQHLLFLAHRHGNASFAESPRVPQRPPRLPPP